MLAVIALVLLLCATVLALVPKDARSWWGALLCAGLACWLWQTGAGILP